MTTRERLHALVDDLPAPEAHAALRFVEYLHDEVSDPVVRLLKEAPLDDEPVTAGDLEALEGAAKDWRAGLVVTHEQARLQLLRES